MKDFIKDIRPEAEEYLSEKLDEKTEIQPMETNY
jgi:hypothetical protein